MRLGAWLFGGVWLTIWTIATLGFDAALVRGIVQEARCRDWPSTQGRVISADIKVEHDSEDGSSYTARIRYLYSVNGIEYQCDRIRYGFNTATKTHARRIVSTYPPGSAVVVHFDSSSPGRAVLETGVLTGSDLFGFIFMVPFNLIMLASWVIAFGSLRGRRGADGDDAARAAARLILGSGGELRVRLTKFTPLGAAAVSAGIAACGLIFMIALTFGTDSRGASSAGCGVLVVAAVYGYRRMRDRIGEGWYDLVIDDGRRTLTLPGKLKRVGAGEIAFDDVTTVDVEKVAGTGDDSDKYRPTLRWVKGYPQSAALVELANVQLAQAFAAWLRGRLGLGLRPNRW
jgi:hypothetical protein